MGLVTKILLTGGTGYLGKRLLYRLLSEGYDVFITVRNKHKVFLDNGFSEKVKYVDVDDGALEEFFKNEMPDLIIHTAASYGRNGESLAEVVEANLSFPVKILNLAVTYGTKCFVNTDTSLPRELNAYSRAKKQFMEWLEICSNKIDVINLQLEYFYGPNDSSTKFITYVLHELQLGKGFIDFTDATPFRDFIYIDDVISAYLVILNNVQLFKGLNTIPVGSGSALMLKDLIIQMRSITSMDNVLLHFGKLPMRENEIMYSCADITILKQLGWKPLYTFEQGIMQTINIEKTSYDTN
ncbi:Nucleoside-diphosphate-sugar epimerase [Pedobacter westerhofensis]|uniref:Nucleoside-diphosphate-sugar epimerase n=1 Tax=Pedobacter westerhofensis TaxID=425512 RepID=A0A521C8U4_9SPHI|nr:NAD(P)-dependent oxidoreductase [Pedobacter westerhofensis]SMO55795.1 Nucleoside-diphosphate-sugar epimerase [Pedobacter westerhofensis]